MTNCALKRNNLPQWFTFVLTLGYYPKNINIFECANKKKSNKTSKWTTLVLFILFFKFKTVFHCMCRSVAFRWNVSVCIQKRRNKFSQQQQLLCLCSASATRRVEPQKQGGAAIGTDSVCPEQQWQLWWRLCVCMHPCVCVCVAAEPAVFQVFVQIAVDYLPPDKYQCLCVTCQSFWAPLSMGMASWSVCCWSSVAAVTPLVWCPAREVTVQLSPLVASQQQRTISKISLGVYWLCKPCYSGSLASDDK